MRPARRTAPIALALALASIAPARAQEPTLITPPRQAEPWTPPATALPRFFVEATGILFDQGLADPRGCEYRAIRIAVGDPKAPGRSTEAATHGWVIPPPRGGEPRHAIAWSGLVYPLAGLDGPADLDADARPPSNPPGPARPVVVSLNLYRVDDENSAVAMGSFRTIRACLLLRLGRADLAEAAWTAAGLRLGPKPGGPGPKLDLTSYGGVSYLSLATELAASRYERALNAHERGDDPLALADARALAAFDRALETRAEAMGFPRPDWYPPSPRPRPYLDFLGQWPRFLADHERRARERADPPPTTPGEGAEGRVAALIRSLDQIKGRVFSDRMGGRGDDLAPTVKALVAEGDPAVDPLIRALRSDGRLTRSIEVSGRSRSRERFVLGVERPAYAALAQLVSAARFSPPGRSDEPDGPGSRRASADAIESYWSRVRDLPVVERWYRTLAEDGAGYPAWSEAAWAIARRRTVRDLPGLSPVAAIRTSPWLPSDWAPFEGEALREGHDPTVAALLARRVEALRLAPRGTHPGLGEACQLGRALVDWDPVAAVPTLRSLLRSCLDRDGLPGEGSASEDQSYWIPSLAESLLRSGDRLAARDYADWIRATPPDRLEYRTLSALQPLSLHPGDPTLAAAAARLFGDPESPWLPLVGRKGRGERAGTAVAGLIGSPMVEVPAFRRVLLAMLADRTRAGVAQVDPAGSVAIRLDAGTPTPLRSPRKGDRDPPAPGAGGAIRLADFTDWELASLAGAPPFHPCWPEPRRDAGLAAMAAFLESKGER